MNDSNEKLPLQAEAAKREEWRGEEDPGEFEGKPGAQGDESDASSSDKLPLAAPGTIMPPD